MDAGEPSLRGCGAGHPSAQVSSDSVVRSFIPEENFVRRVQAFSVRLPLGGQRAARLVIARYRSCQIFVRGQPSSADFWVQVLHSRAIAASDTAFIANKITPSRVIESTAVEIDPPTPERGTATSRPQSRDEDPAVHQLSDEIMRRTDPVLRPWALGSRIIRPNRKSGQERPPKRGTRRS